MVEHHEARDLLGPYVMGALGPREEREVEEHLRGCAVCGEEVRNLRQAHEAMLDLAGTTEAPPPELKERVVAAMPSDRARRRALPSWATAVAAALVVFAVVGGAYFSGFLGRETVASADLEATELAPRADGELRLLREEEPNARAELEVRGLPRPGPNEYYELWFGEEEGRVSAGTFTVDAEGRGTLQMSVPESVGDYGRVGITLERFPEEPRMSSAKVVLGGELRET